jgi:hypothetical protein
MCEPNIPVLTVRAMFWSIVDEAVRNDYDQVSRQSAPPPQNNQEIDQSCHDRQLGNSGFCSRGARMCATPAAQCTACWVHVEQCGAKSLHTKSCCSLTISSENFSHRL